MSPPRPSSSITSGTAPCRVAITGVPHAIDSIITRPNGSSHSIGKSVARAFCSSSTFVPWLTSPRYSIPLPRCGSMNSAKYSFSLRLPHLAGELERQAELHRDRDRAVRALLVVHAAEEEQVVALVRLARVVLEVERVRDVRDPVQVGPRPALVERERDQADLRRDPADRLVDLARLAVERPVDGVHDRRLDEPAEHGAERAGVVVDHVEVARALVGARARAAGRAASGRSARSARARRPRRASPWCASRPRRRASPRARPSASPSASSETIHSIPP